MFLNEDYTNYKYLVEVNDNYVVLSNSSYANGDWQNPDTIDVIYQYLEPSFLVIEDTKTYNTSVSFNEIETSQSFYARADCLELIRTQFYILFFILFLFNALTRFVRKGGVIFGS